MTESSSTNTGTDLTNNTPADDRDVSIVDQILDLDELDSTEVRRAERAVPFYLRADLEAEIDELEARLEVVLESARHQTNQGKATADTALGDAPAASTLMDEARGLAQQIENTRRALAKSRRMARVKQMSEDEWVAFEAKWQDAMKKGSPYPQDMWTELIVKSAAAPVMTAEGVAKLRSKFGHPPVHQLALAAWHVNHESGVSVPKSQLSLNVLNLQGRAAS